MRFNGRCIRCAYFSAGAEAFGMHLLWKGIPGDYGCGREMRSNATLVATPKSAQNNKLVSVTTTINLWDSAAGTAL
jgi:hypothetical protein